MFGIGFSELILIILAVILFVRPADLPKFFREAGKAWAYVKKGLAEANAVKDAFMKQVDDIAKIDEAPAAKKQIAADDWIEIESARQTPAADAGAPAAEPSIDAADAAGPKASAPAPEAPRAGPKPLASFDASDPNSGRGYEGEPKP